MVYSAGFMTIRAIQFVFLFACACGPTARTSHTASHAASPQATDDAWKRLSFEDRHSVMTFKILPNMARTWRDWKKTEYPEMTCRTCHGKDAEVVNYKMPNPSLPPIDPAHPPQNAASQFMQTRVVPDMIAMLETTPEHFSCNACHPKGATP